MSINIFSSIEGINTTYREIWKKYRTNSLATEIEKYFDKWPIQYDIDIKQKEILFVGFNPSYDEDNKPLQLSGIDILDNETEIQKAIEYERTAQREASDKKRYSYYSLFPEICTTLGLNKEDWNHIDVFPFRHGKQNDLVKDFELNTSISDWVAGGSERKDIIRDCVYSFLGFIEYLNPKLIVVVNGFLSKKITEDTGSYFLNYNKSDIQTASSMNKDFSFYLSQGSNECYRILKINNEYPLLLSAMLTGQRALDLGSRERLIWHIGQLL
ncbi:MAG: hypothetical protein M1166_02505 [Candidatus Thermoplasmatota archaeon]|jgi:hypothetical protein|nr:hypothetical protein [Candidatus Thermoplasmatota archaeon]